MAECVHLVLKLQALTESGRLRYACAKCGSLFSPDVIEATRECRHPLLVGVRLGIRTEEYECVKCGITSETELKPFAWPKVEVIESGAPAAGGTKP